MRFAVIGGDRRSVLLCSMLARDGHRVHCFALEKAELPAEIPKAGCLQGCVYGADCVILPTPAESGALVNAPFAAEPLQTKELLQALWPGQLVCGGKLSSETCFAAINAQLRVEDIMRRPDFIIGNAAITAEGALALLAGNSESTLFGSRVLILGFGRIGKLLALKLKFLGASVCAAARRSGQRAEAAALGLDSVAFETLDGLMGDFDFIVNTVPARVLCDAALCCAAEGTVLLELASSPGGFDMQFARNIGLRTVSGSGLPGKYAPCSAAQLIRDTVYEVLNED